MKIGICFPEYDYLNLPFDEFKQYILNFKENGIYSFDFYTSFFLKYKNNLNELLTFLNENKIKITFHYNRNITKNINFDSLLEIYKQDLLELSIMLKNNNIHYKIPIVFHFLDYPDNEKYTYIKQLLITFKQLSTFSLDINFEILIETLSQSYPKGNHIGDEISELNLILNTIQDQNFGICWDTGHTRLNNIEFSSPLLIDKKYFNRIKMVHIHNIYKYKNKFFDHLPFTNLEYQRDEIEYLFINGYDDVYLIEVEVKYLKENISVYLDSINKLKNVILEEIK